MSPAPEPGTVERLRAWAHGSNPLTAAVELLTRAFDGRFTSADQPWIRVEPGGWTWLDDQFLAASLAHLSGGERRVLTVVAALADTTGERRINLVDVVTGLDRRHLDLVLAALAHAAGPHQHTDVHLGGDGRLRRLVPMPPLHDWPSAPPPRAHVVDPAPVRAQAPHL